MKSNKGFIIIIVVLVIGLLATSGYIVYDKFLKEEPVNAENKEKENVDENIKENENLEENEALEKARKEAFSIEVNGLLSSAKQYVITQSLNTVGSLIEENEVGCITIKDLIDSNHSDLNDNYHGTVLIRRDTNAYIYSVYATNNSYMVLYSNTSGINENITDDSIFVYSTIWRNSYDICDNGHPAIDSNENLKYLIN